MKNRLTLFCNRLALYVLCLSSSWVVGMIVFMIYRIIYTYNVLPVAERVQFRSDIFKAFVTGIRFDSVTVSYLLLPILLLGIASSIFIQVERYIRTISKVYTIIVVSCIVLILLIDYYYFSYFQSHINFLVFGFFEDDTKAVTASLWSDYPLVRALLFVVFVSTVLAIIIQRLYRIIFSVALKLKLGLAATALLIFSALYALSLRASFGTFPLQIDDASVSSNSKVNLIPVNGVFSLKEAIVTYKNSMNLEAYKRDYEKLGYYDLMQSYTETKLNADKDSFEDYFAETDTNVVVQESPPHVVFILVESWSNHYLYFHSTQNNLLAGLEQYWNNGIVYRNFLSDFNGTINSLEGLVVNTSITSLAQSAFSGNRFESSCAKPFKENQYETSFITGGKINWRNLNGFIPGQYFDHIYSDADIKKNIHGVKECEWGVYDEYLFDFINEKLKEAKSPQFIFALTTTNHTPFYLPDHYKKKPLQLPVTNNFRLKVDEAMALSCLANLQYSNDCIGNFIRKTKEDSVLRHKTIISATGDHTNLMLYDYNQSQYFYRYSVPFLLWVPEKYLYKSLVDKERWGSHKDIFPTLYNLSLNRARYVDAGIDLLGNTVPSGDCFANNIMALLSMNRFGAVKYSDPVEYYSWNEDKELVAVKANPPLELLGKRSMASNAFRFYLVKSEIDRTIK